MWVAPLKFNRQSDAYLSPCEVVGHGITCVGDVGNPIVGVDVVDSQEVEGVESYPCVLNPFEARVTHEVVVVIKEAIGKPHIDALIGGCSEDVFLALGM